MSHWTEANIAELTALWHQEYSTLEIGRRLHVSKNAVIGKAHKLGLPARPSPIRQVSTLKRYPLTEDRAAAMWRDLWGVRCADLLRECFPEVFARGEAA